jgi:lipoic acid synthetase
MALSPPAAQVQPRFGGAGEFAQIKRIALRLGFKHAGCGPLVRSSYHAHEQEEAATQIT